MKYGCCVDTLARTPDGTPVPNIEQLAELGYDYVELFLASLTALSEDEFQAVLDRLARRGSRVRRAASSTRAPCA